MLSIAIFYRQHVVWKEVLWVALHDMFILNDVVFLQAVALDDSDVTVWYHLGLVALKTFDLCLARHSFEEVCFV